MKNKLNELKRYKVYRFGSEDITDVIDGDTNEYKEFFVSPSIDLKVNEIVLSESAFLNIYLEYFGKEYEEGMLLDNIIIVELSDKCGLSQLQTDISFNGEDYTYLITTPSWTKYEDGKSKGACMMIKKKDIKFKIFFENLISLGEVSKYENQDKKINTEHARLALALSTAYMTNLKPKVIIVDECSGIIISDIVTVMNKEVIEITENTQDDQLKKHRNVPVTQFDGCGVMTKEFANEIKKDGNFNHPITWAGIRMYGIATKGLLVSFDFKKYLNKFYNKKTNFIEKRKDGRIYIKDMFDKWQCIDDVDIIINSSMAKWAEHFKKEGMEKIERLTSNLKLEKYKDIIENMWVTKVNKPYAEIEKYNLTNYQLLGNLNLSVRDLEEIYKPTEEMFLRLLNDDTDAIYLYLNLLKGKKHNYNDDEIETIEEDTISISTVAEQLLAKNPDFIKSDYVKKHVARMIKKQLNLLCSGKAYVESYYKTVTQDPISFCEWLINRTDKETFVANHRGLKAQQFYCSDTSDGEIRTCSRNPLASYSEVLNLKFTQNNFLNGWYEHLSKDLVVCNCHDLTKEIMSGMDFDLDVMNVVNHPIIARAVKTDLPFINVEDINKEKPSKKWTNNNRYTAFITSAGNLIGKIANMTSSVSAEATAYDYYIYVSKTNSKVYSYKKLRELFENKFPKDIVKENIKNEVYMLNGNNTPILDKKGKSIVKGTYLHFKKAVEKGFEKVLNSEISEDQIHEIIDKGFEKYKRDSYYLRVLSMRAIDVPKTLIPIDKDEYKEENEKYSKNPYFLGYKKGFYDEEGSRIKYVFHENAMDINASRIYEEIISKRKQLIEISGTSTSRELVHNFLYNPSGTDNPMWDKCKEEILELYKFYKSNRSNIKIKFEELIGVAENDTQRAELEEKKNRYYKLHDIQVLSKAEYISNKYNDYRLISSVLASYDEKKNLLTSEAFMFNYFNKDTMLMLDENSVTVPKHEYILDDNGDIEFRFKRYRKEDIKVKVNDTEIQENMRQRFINKKIEKMQDTEVRLGYIDRATINQDNLEDLKNNKLEFIIWDRDYKGKTQVALTLNNEQIAFVWEDTDLLGIKGEKVVIKEIIKNNKSSSQVILSRVG